MKTILVPFLVLPLVLTGCARFHTNQIQLDTLDATGKILSRQTRTEASSTTFFDSKSALANFKATQTDKTQTAIVGSLNQEASGSNVVALTESVVRAAVMGAVRAAAPVLPPVPQP